MIFSSQLSNVKDGIDVLVCGFQERVVMNEKILLIEDNRDFQMMVRHSLSPKYEVEVAGTLSEARTSLKGKHFDLILLDVTLPDGLGFDLFSEVEFQNSAFNNPILFLTGRDSLNDKVLGLSLGADDYVTKPFEPRELLARVDLRMSKSKKNQTRTESIQRGPIRLEIPTMSLFLTDPNGKEIRIDATPIEFKIVLRLALQLNKILSRQQLMNAVWGKSVFVDDRSIDKHISAIRRKLSPFGDKIRTVSGVGYEMLQ